MPVITNPASSLIRVRNTYTLSGSAGTQGTKTVFTISGKVVIRTIVGVCTTTLVSAGGGTIALGVTGSTAGFIAATTATDLTNTAGTAPTIWMSATPTLNLLAIPAACKDVAITQNVIFTIATGDITAGVLVIDCWYEPITDGATLT